MPLPFKRSPIVDQILTGRPGSPVPRKGLRAFEETKPSPGFEKFKRPPLPRGVKDLVDPNADVGVAGDAFSSFAQGGIGAIKTLTDLAGADNPVSQNLGQASDYWAKRVSPERKAELELQEREKTALGDDAPFLDQAGLFARQAIRNPVTTIAEGVGNIAPLAATGGVGGLLGIGGRTAAVGLGTAMGAGAVKGGIYETTLATLLAQGVPPEEAQARATEAQSYSQSPGKIAAGAAVGALAGRFGADEAIAGMVNPTKAAARAALKEQAEGFSLRGAATGALREMVTEAPQESIETILGNQGAIDAGGQIDPYAGALEAGVKAGIMSAIPGAGGTVASGYNARRALSGMGPEAAEAPAGAPPGAPGIAPALGLPPRAPAAPRAATGQQPGAVADLLERAMAGDVAPLPQEPGDAPGENPEISRRNVSPDSPRLLTAREAVEDPRALEVIRRVADPRLAAKALVDARLMVSPSQAQKAVKLFRERGVLGLITGSTEDAALNARGQGVEGQTALGVPNQTGTPENVDAGQGAEGNVLPDEVGALAPVVGDRLQTDQAAHGEIVSPIRNLIETEATKVAPEPSAPQKEAGNYRKGHVPWKGLDISIETPKGGVREAADKSWRVENLPAHYGYVRRTEGADGDQVDVYMGDNPDSDRVFVVDQKDAKTGKFDETKTMLGFDSPEAARAAYLGGFSDGRGPDRVQAITETTTQGFKEWIKSGDTKKPFAPAVKRKPVPPTPLTREQRSSLDHDYGVIANALRGGTSVRVNKKAKGEKRRTIADAVGPFYKWDLIREGADKDTKLWPVSVRALAREGGPNAPLEVFKTTPTRGKNAGMYVAGQAKPVRMKDPMVEAAGGLEERVERLIEEGWLPPGSDTSELMGALMSERGHPQDEADSDFSGAAAQKKILEAIEAIGVETGLTNGEIRNAILSKKKTPNRALVRRAILKLDIFGTREQTERMNMEREKQERREERRSEPELRRPVAQFIEDNPEASRDEIAAEVKRLRDELNTDPLTGLGSKRAMDASAKTAPAVVSLDGVGLKWYNDSFGHPGGDKYLVWVGQAMRMATMEYPGVTAFHQSGDEFAFHGPDRETLTKAADLVNEVLRDGLFDVTDKSGRKRVYKGVSIDFGVGDTFHDADQDLLAKRAEDERQGRRAPRGDQPAGLVEVDSDGRPIGGDTVPEAGRAEEEARPEVAPEPEPEAEEEESFLKAQKAPKDFGKPARKQFNRDKKTGQGVLPGDIAFSGATVETKVTPDKTRAEEERDLEREEAEKKADAAKQRTIGEAKSDEDLAETLKPAKSTTGNEPERLRFDPATNKYTEGRGEPAKPLVRGTIVTDKTGQKYRVDRANGFMVDLDKIPPIKVGKAGTFSVSVDPFDEARFVNLTVIERPKPVADIKKPEKPDVNNDEREALIQRIAKASERPMFEIQERFEFKATNGKWYRIGGLPWGVNLVKPEEKRSIGFSFQSPQGTAVGTLTKDRETLERNARAVAEKNVADFTERLRGMTDAEIQSQAEYWLKNEPDYKAKAKKAKDSEDDEKIRAIVLEAVPTGNPWDLRGPRFATARRDLGKILGLKGDPGNNAIVSALEKRAEVSPIATIRDRTQQLQRWVTNKPATEARERADEYGAESRDLILQHNLTAANLIHADKMGGLAVPSMAVAKADMPLEKHGLQIERYDQNDPDARRKAIKRASETEGIAFERGETYGAPFFSQLERAAEQMKQPMRGSDALRFLSTREGVKAAELKWTGLDDFLQKKAGERVTPEEVKEFLKANKVTVKEVQRGGEARNIQDIHDDMDHVDRRLEQGDIDDAEHERLARALREEKNLNKTQLPTKFSQYQLPGGKNYREVLLTLPSKEKPIDGYVKHDPSNKEYPWAIIVNGKEVNRSKHEAVAPDILEDELSRARKNSKSADSFHSGHWSEPNILAHVRMNERTDSEGRRVLFLEEVQSDHAQQARRRGIAYKPTPEQAKRGAELEKVAEERDFTPSEQAEWDTLRPIIDKNMGGVPPAPFIERTEDWVALALKSVLHYAAANGFDSVAWTPGSVQAERYSLSKQVREIVVMPKADGSRAVRIEPKEGTSIKLMVDEKGIATGAMASSSEFTGKRLDDIIGKDMAEKVMGSTSEEKFTGEGLNVGGEGMKAFYDRIVPQVAEKIGKKFGAKVGTTEIQTPREVRYVNPDGTDVPVGDGVVAGAKRKDRTTTTVQSLPITPEMRAAVPKEGFALFEPKEAAYARLPDGRPYSAPRNRADARRDSRQARLDFESIPDTQREIPGPRVGSGVRVLGAFVRITEELKSRGWIDLRGQRIQTHRDLAVVARVYRDPRFETFRIFYVDDESGTILAHEAMTSRMAGAVRTFTDPKKDTALMRDRIRRLEEKTGKKVGYYLLHNHPGGKPDGSAEDRQLTSVFARFVPGFKDHVILDGDEYGVIKIHGLERDAQMFKNAPPALGGKGGTKFIPDSGGFDVEQNVFKLKGPDVSPDKFFVESPEKRRVADPAMLASMWAAWRKQVPSDHVVVAALDSANVTRAVFDVPRGLFLNREAFAEFMRGQSPVFGFRGAVAAIPPGDRHLAEAAVAHHRGGVLLDFAGIDGRRTYVDAVSGEFGRDAKQRDIPRFRVAEPTEDRIPPGDPRREENFRKWFGDSKVVDKAGKPLVVYHGTGAAPFTEFEGYEAAGWFSEDPRIAESRYATDYGSPRQGPRLVPVYLAIKNPLDLSGKFDMDEGISLKDIYAKAGLQPVDDQNLDYDGLAYEVVNDHLFIEAAQAAGYDGIKVTEDGAPTWAAFEKGQIKSATGNRGTFDPANPNIAAERSDRYNPPPAEPPTGPTDGERRPEYVPSRLSIPDETFLQKIEHWLRHKLNRVGVIQQAVKEQRPTKAAPVDLEDAFVGVSPRAAHNVMNAEAVMVNPIMEFIGKNKLDFHRLGRYAMAVHAPDADRAIVKEALFAAAFDKTGKEPESIDEALHVLGKEEAESIKESLGNPSGMSPERVKEILDEVEKSGKKEQYEEARKRILDIQTATNNLRVLVGLSSPETVNRWREKYGDNFVHLWNEDAGTLDRFMYTGQGFGVRGPEVRRRRGRKTEASAHPLISAVQDLERTILRAEKERALQDFANWVKNVGDSNLGRVRKGEPGEDGIGYKVDGVQWSIDVPDPRLREQLQNLATPQLDVMTQTLGAFTRFFSKINTAWSPPFLIRNGVRDYVGAIISSYILHGAKGGILRSVASDVMKNQAAAMKGVIDFMKNPAGPHPPGSWAAQASDASRLGAVPGYFNAVESMKAIHEKLTSALKKRLPASELAKLGLSEAKDAAFDPDLNPAEKAARLASVAFDAASRTLGLKAAFDLLLDANKAVEMATRVNYFAALKKAGKNEKDAANMARNLTDFNKRGEATSMLNAIWSFFNANVQGTTRIAEMLTSNDPEVKKRAIGTMAGLMAAGMLWDVVVAALSGDGDDDDIPDSDQMPDWALERNFIIPAMGNLAPILIPLAQGFNVPFFAGQMIAKVMRGRERETEAAKAIFLAAANSYNPIGTTYGLPTAVQPGIEVLGNRDWRGAPVTPVRYPGMEGLPDSQLAWKWTSAEAKAAAQGLNRATGGDESTPGLIDLSPATLDHFARFFGGGLGRFAQDVWNAGMKLTHGEAPERVPFVSSFTLNPEAGQRARFYEQLQELEELENRAKNKERVARVEDLRDAYPGADVGRMSLTDLRKAMGGGMSTERSKWLADSYRQIDARRLVLKDKYEAAAKALKELNGQPQSEKTDEAKNRIYRALNQDWARVTGGLR